MKPEQVILLTTLVFMTGCDTLHGVAHHANLGSVVLPLACVVRATQSIPGVSDVERREEKGGRQLTLTGLHEPEIINRVYYKYQGLNGNFYFVTNYQGHSIFRHTYMDINKRPPQNEVDSIRPVMREIEKAMAVQCPAVAGIGRAVEACHGVQCPQ